MKRNNIIWSLLALSSVGVAQAQSSFEFDKSKVQEVGLNSNNASLLVTNDMESIGESSIYYKQTNGKFKNPLNANKSRFGGFSTQRYQRINNWKLYGKFDLSFGQDKDVANTTQIYPFRLNPYIIVDSLVGDWNKQYYNIEGKVASPIVREEFVFGLGLKYNVATGARQLDPRPQNSSNDITLTPSITYFINEINALGINGLYGHFVEDFTVQNVNTTTVHNMYKLIGLGEYISSNPIFLSSGSITRRYNGNKYGGAVQYVHKGENIRLFGEGFAHYNKENAIDGTLYPQQAGLHEYLHYGMNAEMIFNKGQNTHRLQGAWSQYDVKNTEFHQYQDAATKEYITLYWESFNTNLVTQASFDYAYITSKNDNLNWIITAGAAYSGWDNKYSLNKSQQTVDRLSYTVNFKKYFTFENSSALKIEVLPSYSTAFDSDFTYDEKSYSSNFVAKNILYPTNAYLSATYLSLDASIQYNFKKSSKNKTQPYIKISENYNRLMNDVDYFKKGQHRLMWQVAIGLLTL